MDIEQLRRRFSGDVVLPGDEGYDAARMVWNGNFDRRPAVIARCSGAADVAAAVCFAQEQDLVIAVRGGGHSLAGWSTCDGGVLIDLSPMKGIRVDPRARVAVAEAGLLWGEYDAATQQHGLATTGGEVSHTGIAGLTLGGGIGWLKRRFGLTCDSLRAAEMVTAEGRVVHATEETNPELLWGLRGGGGNFGVVTRFTYDLHEVGPLLLGGSVMHAADKAKEVLAFFRDWSAEVPDEISLMVALITAPPAPFMPTHLVGRPVVVVGAAYIGPIDEGEEALRPVREFANPDVDVIAPLPYVALQSMIDFTVPHGMQHYTRSEFLGPLDDGAIDALISGWHATTSPLNQILVHQMGGALARVARDATAFRHRDASFSLLIDSQWGDPREDRERHASWTRALWECLRPWSSGVYVNHLAGEGEDRVREAYGDSTYDRLVNLKTAWDPKNVFHRNQNIRPRTRVEALP